MGAVRVGRPQKRPGIPNRLQAVRLELGYTQENVEWLLGLTHIHLSFLECGHALPAAEELSQFCSVYQCRPEELYEETYLRIINGTKGVNQ